MSKWYLKQQATKVSLFVNINERTATWNARQSRRPTVMLSIPPHPLSNPPTLNKIIVHYNKQALRRLTFLRYMEVIYIFFLRNDCNIFSVWRNNIKKIGANWITRVAGYLTVCTTFFYVISNRQKKYYSYFLLFNSKFHFKP